MGILSAIGGVLGGGLTGILGVGLQGIMEYKTKQLEAEAQKDRLAHEAEMRRIDGENMAKESAARLQVSRVEADSREQLAESAAFSASFATEPVRYSDGVKPNEGQGWLLVGLDVIRGLVRPLLTLYLCGITTMVYLQARSLLDRQGVGLSSEQAISLVNDIIATILYLTTTVVCWWFGSRAKDKPKK